MFRCLNKWNNLNTLDGYCRDEPDCEITYAEVDTEKKYPQYSKCKCNEKECLNYQSWKDVCEQNRGNILWLSKERSRVAL
jgi:hypothetical protein